MNYPWNKYRRIILITCVTMLVLVILGCAVDEQDIKKYGDNYEIEKLAKFIEKNSDQPDQAALVKLAATQLYQLPISPLFLNETLDAIINRYNSDLFRHTLLVEDATIPDWYTYNTILTYLLKEPNAKNYTYVLKITNKALEVGLQPADSIRITRDAVKSIIDLKQLADSLTLEVSRLTRSVKSKREQVEDLYRWYAQNYPRQLGGFIRAQFEDGMYEIQSGQQSAILIATDSRFETNGYFEMWATEVMETPVKLREEYGGITKKLKVFREVPKVEREARFELGSEKIELAETIRQEITPIEKEISAIEYSLKKISGQIETQVKIANKHNYYDISYEGETQ